MPKPRVVLWELFWPLHQPTEIVRHMLQLPESFAPLPKSWKTKGRDKNASFRLYLVFIGIGRFICWLLSVHSSTTCRAWCCTLRCLFGTRLNDKNWLVGAPVSKRYPHTRKMAVRASSDPSLILLQGRYAQDLTSLVESILHLQRSRAHCQLMMHVCRGACQSWAPIKLMSHHGANVVNGRAVDSGNVAYSVIWVGLLGVQLEAPAHAPAVRSRTSLIQAALTRWYPSLSPDQLSNNAYEHRGDVIETLLALWRLARERVFSPEVTVEERRLWLVWMESACGAARRLIRVLPYQHAPPTSLLHAITIAYNAHKMPQPASRTGRQKFRRRVSEFGNELVSTLGQYQADV